MIVQDEGTIDAALAAFDRHLHRTRGTHPVVRHNYTRYVRMFLGSVFGNHPVDLARPTAADVIGFMSTMAARYRPRGAKLVATSLRSFFRFLRTEGFREDQLAEAVPSVADRRLSTIPRSLSEEAFKRLLGSLDRSSPRALRDSAIILCLARLGLRASEVVGLRLDDLDWRAGTLHVRARKTGRGAILPLPRDVGRAIVAYLRSGRPPTPERHVFVLHGLRVGAPATRQVVGDAVERALRRAGIAAPVRGAYLLRHTLATRMLRRGANLKQIADLLGHRCLNTTVIYAKVDLSSLGEVALPWPEVAS